MNLGALGKVPNAALADTATDATTLGGSPASDYRLHCPGGLTPAADICFEPTKRTAGTWRTAVQTCGLANRRLPTVGELVLVFNNAAGGQISQWTSLIDSNGFATVLDDDGSRQIQEGFAQPTASEAYRCVTNATN